MTGATGAQGTAGTNGAQGAAGPQGATGTTGGTGAQGNTGAQGFQGTVGSLAAPLSASTLGTCTTNVSAAYTATCGGVTGPSVTLNSATTTRVMVIVTGHLGIGSFLSYSLDGGVALDANAMIVGTGVGSATDVQSSTVSEVTISGTSNTFALEYKANALSTATFSDRTITVIPLN